MNNKHTKTLEQACSGKGSVRTNELFNAFCSVDPSLLKQVPAGGGYYRFKTKEGVNVSFHSGQREIQLKLNPGVSSVAHMLLLAAAQEAPKKPVSDETKRVMVFHAEF